MSDNGLESHDRSCSKGKRRIKKKVYICMHMYACMDTYAFVYLYATCVCHSVYTFERLHQCALPILSGLLNSCSQYSNHLYRIEINESVPSSPVALRLSTTRVSLDKSIVYPSINTCVKI